MTPSQMNDLKQRVIDQMHKHLDGYIGEALTEMNLITIQNHLQFFLVHLVRMGEHPVLAELEPRISVFGTSSIQIYFKPKTERAEKFLLGQEFW